DMLYSAAVLSGPEHTQLISALGKCVRRLYIIARSVASLPRLPAPKCPNRTLLWRVGSGLIWVARLFDTANSGPDRRWWKNPPGLSDGAHGLPYAVMVQYRRFETFHSNGQPSRDATAPPSCFVC